MLQAVNMVRMKGYGVVMPMKEEIVLNQPEVIRHGALIVTAPNFLK